MGKVHSEIGASEVQGGRSFTVEDRSGDEYFDIPAGAQAQMPPQQGDIPDHEIVNPYAKRQAFPTQVPQQPQPAYQPQPVYQQQPTYQQQPQQPQRIPGPQQPVRPTTAEEAMNLRRTMIGQGQGALAEDAKRRIEALIGLGRGHRDVEINDGSLRVVFTLRTIKGKEQRDIVALTQRVQREQEAAGVYDLRHAALKYSLHAIDGVAVDQFLGIHLYSPEDRIAARLRFIENLDETTVTTLFREYESLMQENFDRHLPKTEEEVKEVVDQITKSGQET